METENFDQLKKLLALKKHEQPPPRYFDTFSSKVLARIQAEEQPKSWWQRVLAFNARPLMAGTYGLAVVAMLGFVVTVLVKQPATNTTGSAARQPRNVAQPNVNEGNASMPLENEPNSNIVVASNDAAPSFLFNPNGVFDSNSQFKTAPANFKQTGE